MATKEIKDVVGLGIGIAELVDGAADGVSLSDIWEVVGLLKKVRPAVDAVKGGKLLGQYKALTVEERAELSGWFDSELDIKDDKMELVVEQAFKAVLELAELLDVLKPPKVVTVPA